jgi:hypothetical protein
MSALEWVGQNYYWKDTIIMISDSTYSLFEGWIGAATLAHVFHGDLLDAIQDNPDLINRSFINASEYDILAISNDSDSTSDPYAYYNPNAFEMQLLQQVHPNVYQVKQGAFDLRNWEDRYFSHYIDLTEQDGWFLPKNVEQDRGMLLFNMTFTPKRTDDVWVSHPIEINTGQYDYLLVRMNIDEVAPRGTPYLVVRVQYDDGTYSTLEHHMHFTHSHYGLLELKKNSMAREISLAYTDHNRDISEGSYEMRIDLVAFGSIK